LTIRDLEKLISQQQQTTTQQDEELNRLKSKLTYGNTYKRFYIWSEPEHKLRYKNSNGNCCFWHVIGAPRLNNHDMPALPYQKLLEQTLREHQCILIKKSRGLGVTEYLLRHIAYCCVTGIFPENSRVCLTTGPRIDIAEDLISRFKSLFSRVAPSLFDKSKSTVAILNTVKVEAFPSHNCASMRGLDNVKFIMSDESDFYPKFQQQEIRAVAEGYLAKPNSSDLKIIFVSTPNAPGGLLQQIELEKDSLYYRLFLDYRYGLEGPNPIYSEEHINNVMKSPEYRREYCLEYLGLVGNVFSHQSIDNATKIEYNPDNIVQESQKSIGLDPAWGSSNFALVATQFVDGKIQVIFADEFPRPFFQAMIDKVWELKQKLGVVTNIYCDSSSPEVIQSLKRDFHEPYDNQWVKEKIAWCKKNKRLIENYMTIVPISFSVDGANLLTHFKSLLESPDNLVAIHPRYDKLLTSLRTAVAIEMKLQKQDTVYDDILDAARLAMWYYKFS
jgi:hypothetical protein